jgi:sugar-specific transcriptional regulator TrmB/DNA-binding CsgD family transcriptional regulator
VSQREKDDATDAGRNNGGMPRQRVAPLPPDSALLDLAPDLLAAYRVAVAATSIDADGLAAKLALDASSAEHVLTALSGRGVVTRLAGAGGDRYIAVSPDAVLGAGLREREESLRQAQRDLAHLQEVYDLASAEASAADLGEVIEVVRGADQVAQGFARIQASARREVLAFASAPVAVTPAPANVAEQQAVSRGVKYRVVVERALIADEDDWERLRADLADGEDARIADHVPLKLTIVDRERAFVPVLADPLKASAAALIVRPSALLTGLIALFDTYWASAMPVRVEADEGPLDDLGVQIMSLLMAGYTDDTAARMLGISMRTVQRRVRELMTLTGSQTRMQLGWHAARNGWLTGRPPGPANRRPGSEVRMPHEASLQGC